MIPSNELRIGNWVDLTGNSYYGKVLSINGEAIQDNTYLECGESFEWTEWQTLTPIPLTPEILENNFGLKMITGTSDEYRIGNLVLTICLYSQGYKTNIYIGAEYLGYQTSVHGFQNLYFALTGEELKNKF